MLHIVPHRRPTADQILRHPWLWQYNMTDFHASNILHQQHTINAVVVPTINVINNVQLPENTVAIKQAVNATFRAISSPHTANLGPVKMSELATRRLQKKKSANS